MATVSSNASAIRRRLRALGERRKKQEKKDEELTADIKRALEEADGVITVSEQADLLDMHRTTLYRVYM